MLTAHIFPRGWNHPNWDASFYPDDIPADWRPSFFANEFPGVLIPQEELLLAQAEASCEQWAEAVGDKFRFYLECRDASQLPSILACAKALGPGVAGLVMVDAVLPDDAIMEDLAVFQGGSIDQACEAWSYPLAVLLDAEQLGSLREQRFMLEGLNDNLATHTDMPIFLMGAVKNIETLRQFRQLAELLEFV